ncbi:MAG TPA: hypothetical protein VK658_01315 [Chryseolinea sp.]|nr:hypothetical protein [Chryseolinea sp.]
MKKFAFLAASVFACHCTFRQTIISAEKLSKLKEELVREVEKQATLAHGNREGKAGGVKYR